MTNERDGNVDRNVTWIVFFADWRRILLSLGAVLFAGAIFTLGVFLKDKKVPAPPILTMPETRFVEPTQETTLNDLGTFTKWSKVEIVIHGPETSVMDMQQNPFEIVVDVTFTGPDGGEYTVPAFYDGDGVGGYTGNVWKARFSADAAGRWQFSSESTVPSLAGYRGSFTVEEPEGCEPYEPGGLPDFYCAGRLQYEPGRHYLKFADGGYWIKGGIDDPENLLGEALGDWPEKMEAIDYLREQGANSVYFITNNITPGDRNDTWPWVGETSDEAKENSDRYDVARLQAWETFFTYVQEQGIVLHFILADDSVWSDFDHYLYYREMVARFAHHPGLIWNIGEEANEVYWDSEQIELAEFIKSIDAYGNPVTVHRKPPWPFIGEEVFDLTSIQPGDGAGDFDNVLDTDLNEIVREHREASVEAGRAIPIMIDETPRVTRIDEETRYIMRSAILYPIFLAGGNYEMHYLDSYPSGEGLRIEEMTHMLREMRYARALVESVPYADMAPCNELLGETPGAYCLGEPGEVYVLYTALGAPMDVDLSAIEGTAWLQWYDPRTGTYSNAEAIEGGGSVQVTPPNGQDMAGVIHRTAP